MVSLLVDDHLIFSQKVQGMTEQDYIERALVILEARLQKTEYSITSPKDAHDYLVMRLAQLEHESFRLMLLNNKHRVIDFLELFKGTIDGAAVYPREVIKATLAFNAAAVILVHNHPSGDCEPSTSDKHITNKLQEALKAIDVRVLDHVIVGGKDTYSFAEHGLI